MATASCCHAAGGDLVSGSRGTAPWDSVTEGHYRRGQGRSFARAPSCSHAREPAAVVAVAGTEAAVGVVAGVAAEGEAAVETYEAAAVPGFGMAREEAAGLGPDEWGRLGECPRLDKVASPVGGLAAAWGRAGHGSRRRGLFVAHTGWAAEEAGSFLKVSPTMPQSGQEVVRV